MSEASVSVLPWPVTFSDGAVATAVAYDKQALMLTLICDRAHPPGRPLALIAYTGAEDLPLQGRSGGNKRRDDGSFTVTMRLVSLRREQRALLEGATPEKKPVTDGSSGAG